MPPPPDILAGCTRRSHAGMARADLVICCTPLLHTRAVGLFCGRGLFGPLQLGIYALLLRLSLALFICAGISPLSFVSSLVVISCEALPGLHG